MTVKELMGRLQELAEQSCEDKIVVVDNEMDGGTEVEQVYIFEDEAILSC